MPSENRSLALARGFLFIGALLVGLAQVAALPPWEGVDEIAHHSYIQQLAETGTWPHLGDPLSAYVEDYLLTAPASTSIPRARSYRDFFASPATTIEGGRSAVHSAQPQREWQPGRTSNWEHQHPPFYYGLMAPLYLLSKGWSLASQLFLMRGVSYFFAWIGLCLATLLISKGIHSSLLRSALELAAPLWPLLFPMWFPEMGRLGNDSLVLLLAACAWLGMKRLVASKHDRYAHLSLGACLGLGLLTKATFLPFVAVVAGMLSFRAWCDRGNGPVLASRLRGLCVFFAALVAVAGWWYVLKFLETGNAIGSNDVINMTKKGGMIDGLIQNGSLYAFAKASWILVSGFVWAGTWSCVMPPAVSLAPLFAMILLLAFGYIRSVRKHSPHFLDLVPLLTLGTFMAGLCYLSLTLIAAGAGGAPAWYLHSLAPILMPLLGYGLAGLMAVPRLCPAAVTLMFYPMAFLPFAWVIQLLFFAGCGTHKLNSTFFDLPSAASCATDLSTIYERLGVLGFPQLAIPLFAIGWGLMMIGAIAAVSCLRAGAAARTCVFRNL